MLYSKQELNNVLFFDIETIEMCDYNELDDNRKQFWDYKYANKSIQKELEHFKQLELENCMSGVHFVLEDLKLVETEFQTKKINKAELFTKYAPLYAELGMISCISVGVLELDGAKYVLESYLNDSLDLEGEKSALGKFFNLLSGNNELILGGYNIKGFDIPFILKRSFIQQIKKLPKQFQLRGKKPWEVTILDLMEDWKGLAWEAVSLESVCFAMGVKTPKDKFQNYEMNLLLKNGKITIEEVAEYCEKDVKAVIEICEKLIK